ncbi:acyl-CoA dehydrogenase family protein, partial [Corynebacterium matruchotii]|uniref:acyl-CoA dehydrogenase family protein n=1 Tax=Corynebacterium matruchotii TaxID=43768 RepID=UPI0028E8947D
MTAIIEQATAPLVVDPSILETVSEKAKAVDAGTEDARYILPVLAEVGLLDTDLLTAARTVREISRRDLSVGFTIWAHLMTQTYLANANKPAASAVEQSLRSGARPGITGMAAAFKEFAGCGEIELAATPVEGGYRVTGKLNWASNLYDDAVLVTAVRTDAGDRLLIFVEGGAEGLTFGKPFGLLGLNATASAWVSLENVFVPESQVLTHDFDAFILQVRPTFVVLQIAECIGVAEAAIAAASERLFGVNATFADEVQDIAARVSDIIARQESIITRVGNSDISPVELLELRLDAAEVAVAAANVEVRVAGGAGYAKSSPASRRFREAAFIPVQSPSEAQLRW